ncbi:MAG: MMPL family transporter [Deltaproteobacteria bacterium]|nr:MMPL family transporter [Deltaproteobacteria bacterium]
MRYLDVATRRPGATLAALLAIAAIFGVIGGGLGVRSNLEDLFPEHTPAVLAAKRAREILPSSNQMVVVFGSPERQANRRLAADFCAKAEAMPEIASVECRRDIAFFRKNAVLWLEQSELEKLDARVATAIRDATAKTLVDPSLTAGLPDAATGADVPAGAVPGGGGDPADDFGDDPVDDPADDFGAANGANADVGDPADDFGDEADETAPERAPKAPMAEAAMPKPAADGKAGGRMRLPSEAEILERFGKDADLREWMESPDGTVLGVKLFPRVKASDVEASAKLTANVRGLLDGLTPTGYHPAMEVAIRGDYAEMSAEVDAIRHGLAVTTLLALLGIALIQIWAFRQLRALLLLFVPLGVGIALTVGFARLAIGYVNLITAFIFGILFGLGNDFGVYALTRYRESRAQGLSPQQALADAMPTLWSALRTAALTTAAGFLSLSLFEFRGFSQFGLIAGVGVLLALVATMAVFPPLVLVLHRIWPEADVAPERTGGLRWMGWLTRPGVARPASMLLVALAVVGAFFARDLSFDTNFRKLRSKPKKVAAGDTAPVDAAAARRAAQSKLGARFGREAGTTNRTPILVVTDGIDDALAVHRQLELRRPYLTRLQSYVSIHSFLPQQQQERAAIAQRIRERIEAKRSLLQGEDAAEADRALELLHPEPFAAEDLPDFVRKRFLDTSGTLGRFVLVYANGNLADARSVAEVIEQMGHFEVGPKSYRSTASFFMLAEADAVVRKEGPIAVLLAALAVLLVTFFHYRQIRPVLLSFIPLMLAFATFLGAAQLAGLQLNLFSITVLPSIFGIGIDGTVHLVHRCWGEKRRDALRQGVQQIGGAAWIAALTTVVGFGALAFQDNPGVQSLGEMAVWGILAVTTLANALTAAWLAQRSSLED